MKDDKNSVSIFDNSYTKPFPRHRKSLKNNSIKTWPYNCFLILDSTRF